MPKILVVDDSPLMRELTEQILVAHGFSVTVASDGSEGFERACAERFDLIITDLEMPHCNGLELLQALRAAGNTVKVVLFSGIDADDLQEYLRHGFARALKKPFRNDEMVATVHEVLANA